MYSGSSLFLAGCHWLHYNIPLARAAPARARAARASDSDALTLREHELKKQQATAGGISSLSGLAGAHSRPRRFGCRRRREMELILLCTAAAAAMCVSAAPAVDGRGSAVDESDSDGYPLAAIKRPINMHAQRSSSGLFDMENNDDGWQ